MIHLYLVMFRNELKSKFASDRLRFHKELPTQATFSFGGQTGQTTSGAVFKCQKY
jgi:hypothetical protein